MGTLDDQTLHYFSRTGIISTPTGLVSQVHLALLPQGPTPIMYPGACSSEKGQCRGGLDGLSSWTPLRKPQGIWVPCPFLSYGIVTYLSVCLSPNWGRRKRKALLEGSVSSIPGSPTPTVCMAHEGLANNDCLDSAHVLCNSYYMPHTVVTNHRWLLK